MSKRMEISQARGNLAHLAAEAADGEEIVLTRYGKDICKIMPLSSVSAAFMVTQTAAEPQMRGVPTSPGSGTVKYDQHAVDDLLHGLQTRSKGKK